MNLNGVMGVGVDVGGTHVVVDAGLHALGSFADPGRARADVVERGSVVRLAGPVANRHSIGQPAEHTETITGPMTLILINDQAEWDVCRCSVRGPVSRRVSESVSGRAEAPRIAGWSLVAGVGSRASRVWSVAVVRLVRLARLVVDRSLVRFARSCRLVVARWRHGLRSW